MIECCHLSHISMQPQNQIHVPILTFLWLYIARKFLYDLLTHKEKKIICDKVYNGDDHRLS